MRAGRQRKLTISALRNYKFSLKKTTFSITLYQANTVGRIGGGAADAVGAFHACMVIVVRDDHEDGRGALGGGSIVSRNRVLTAAHVVRDALSIAVGFYVTDLTERNLRRGDATFWQKFSSFDPVTLLDDIAVLTFRANAFPQANVIPISNAAAPAVGAATSLASYGFTQPDGTTGSRRPLLAPHLVQACVAPLLEVKTDTHFCALSTAPAIVCTGDNGSGLYTGTGATARLVGVVSTLRTDCSAVVQTAFTALGDERIQRFLVSQALEPVAPV